MLIRRESFLKAPFLDLGGPGDSTLGLRFVLDFRRWSPNFAKFGGGGVLPRLMAAMSAAKTGPTISTP